MITTLPPSALYRSCDPVQFTFKLTAELDDLTEIVAKIPAGKGGREDVGV